MDMPGRTPPSDPVAFTRAQLKEIADVWVAVAKLKLAPYSAKIPAPIAKYLKLAEPTETPSPAVA